MLSSLCRSGCWISTRIFETSSQAWSQLATSSTTATRGIPTKNPSWETACSGSATLQLAHRCLKAVAFGLLSSRCPRGADHGARCFCSLGTITLHTPMSTPREASTCGGPQRRLKITSSGDTMNSTSSRPSSSTTSTTGARAAHATHTNDAKSKVSRTSGTCA